MTLQMGIWRWRVESGFLVDNASVVADFEKRK
jgi:hypothetical protein